jgi:hypothetical protein
MSRNRDFLHIQPLGTSRRLSLLEGSTLAPALRGVTKVAEHDNSGHLGARDIGWLVLLASGLYAILTVQGTLQTVNQRKAELAVKRMGKQNDQVGDTRGNETGAGDPLPGVEREG